MLKIPCVFDTVYVFGKCLQRRGQPCVLPHRLFAEGERHRGEGPRCSQSAEAARRDVCPHQARLDGGGVVASPLWTVRSVRGPRISEAGELKRGGRVTHGPALGGGGHALRWGSPSLGFRPGFATALIRGSPAIRCAFFSFLPADTHDQGHWQTVSKCFVNHAGLLDERHIWYCLCEVLLFVP